MQVERKVARGATQRWRQGRKDSEVKKKVNGKNIRDKQGERAKSVASSKKQT